MRCLLVFVTAAILTAAGEMNMTVAQLVMFIRSSVQLREPDIKVAEYLRKVKLRDKLEDRTIEDLQSQGAGPKTVAALRELSEASASLTVAPPPPPPPVYVPPPPPSSEEQAKIIDQTREYALNYTKQLPNFICVQVTRRDVDPTGAGNNFTVIGPDIGRDSLLIGAGATVILSDRVSTYLFYDGEVARTNYQSHNVSGGVRISF